MRKRKKRNIKKRIMNILTVLIVLLMLSIIVWFFTHAAMNAFRTPY